MFEKYKKYSAPLLRVGVSIVFLWFGINQLLTPEAFIGYVPAWAPASALLFNGILETVLGLLLISGFYTRIAALILSVHLLIITISLGYNEIAVRDLGLTIATVAVMLNGQDRWGR